MFLGLIIFHKVKSDGNCFYRAVSVSAGFQEDSYMKLKQTVSKWLIYNRLHYAQNLQGIDIQQLLLNIQQDFKYAGEQEIKATSDALGKCIIVHQNHQKNDKDKALIYNPAFKINGIIEIIFNKGLNENGQRILSEQGHFNAITRKAKKNGPIIRQYQNNQDHYQQNKFRNKRNHQGQQNNVQFYQEYIQQPQKNKGSQDQVNIDKINNYHQNSKQIPEQQSKKKQYQIQNQMQNSENEFQQNSMYYSEPNVQNQSKQKDQVQHSVIKPSNNQQRYTCEQCNKPDNNYTKQSYGNHIRSDHNNATPAQNKFSRKGKLKNKQQQEQ
ncbi:hypothetical protein pb186bvf_005098 [Paramecium bursaria]